MWQFPPLRWHVGLCALLVMLLAGCRTPSPFAPLDLSQPGWTQRQYQVVWQAKPDANEMVCDVLEARHPSGKIFLQVSKTPLILATVQTEGEKWWVEYGPRPRYGKGTTIPNDANHLWVLIALQKTNATNLKIETLSNQSSRWTNEKTGEQIQNVPAKATTAPRAFISPLYPSPSTLGGERAGERGASALDVERSMFWPAGATGVRCFPKGAA
ncbi:MAG: hypothetical protein K0Q55_1192 [Verrucomicrobia bacterium]|jgi:hypothetical protein|nr:hypothetical protein [Verrucomicrobiota bacterium]